jgi:hypothetical protein
MANKNQTQEWSLRFKVYGDYSTIDKLKYNGSRGEKEKKNVRKIKLDRTHREGEEMRSEV